MEKKKNILIFVDYLPKKAVEQITEYSKEYRFMLLRDSKKKIKDKNNNTQFKADIVEYVDGDKKASTKFGIGTDRQSAGFNSFCRARF